MILPSETPGALYLGDVVHRRLRPVRHHLRYRVFSLLTDVDRRDEVAASIHLLSYNRPNLISLYDADHGDGSRNLRAYLDRLCRRTCLADVVVRFHMLAYPRILGIVFNPLTVYYGYDDEGAIRLVVYEVRNTFGQMMSYVVPAADDGTGVIVQSAEKAFYVSPFNDASGTYDFRITAPSDDLSIGIALRQGDEALLNAHFRASRRKLTDATLLAALAATGWMTLKVVAGIHLEAARLWLKGLRPRPRPPAPERDIRFATPPAARQGQLDR